MKPGDWTCPGCGILVFSWRHACRSCNTPKPGGAVATAPNGERPGDWNCSKCGELCFAWRQSCRSCGTSQSGGTAMAAPNGQREGDWSCPNCGELCFSWRQACRSCNTPRSGGASVQSGGKAGDWNCPGCGELVFSWRDSCRMCNLPRGGKGARFQPYGMLGGKGKGCSKGKGKVSDKMQFDKAKTVWVGSLPDGATNDELLELGNAAGSCQQALVVKQGTGMIEYSSPEETAQAVHVLNGATFKDVMIQADLWQK